jgi:hypothetical protein
VLPFSKRPPPPEEYFLRSGDFEAVRPNHQHPPAQDPYGHVIPSAPRAPVFARQAAHTPYGFAQHHQNNPYNHSQYGDLSAPPPPHSLAPVAMGGPDSTGRSYAHQTGSYSNRTNGPIVVREKPSLKWGIMIAFSGALLGGVLGLGMDARRQTASAAAASEAKDNAPPAMVVAALPQALPQPVAVAAPRPVAPAAPPAPVLAGNGVVPLTQAIAGQAPAAVVLAPAPAVVVTPPKAEAKIAHAHAAPHFAPAPVKPHGFLATKVNPPKAAPEPKEAPEPKAAPEAKQAKADPKPEKTETKPASKKDASTSDAMKILEAANKDTTNTL